MWSISTFSINKEAHQWQYHWKTHLNVPNFITIWCDISSYELLEEYLHDRSPAGPDGMQIKWPSSFPSWELQRGSERKSLTHYSTTLKTFSALVNKDKGTHQAAEG